MIVSTAVLVAEDAQTLFDRALKGKSICAFGEDGLGRFGQQSQAQWFGILRVDVEITGDDEDPMLMEGLARIYLDGYDSEDTGHIMTDRNFEICLQAFLKNVGVDPSCISWPDELENQGYMFVGINFNVPRLIGFI